jgi:hypothetical protein
MTGMNKVVLALATAGLLSSGAAQAALVDRGGGLLYDNVLNVTWLQDANYAKTSGYDTDGMMNWDQARTWAANLVYHDSVRNVDYSDWRLAWNSPISGGSTWNYTSVKNGTTDVGYNITSKNSELAYMYYVNLGLKSYYALDGRPQSGYGVQEMNGVEANVGLVKNLVVAAYWSGTEDSWYSGWMSSSIAHDTFNSAWDFNTHVGDQGYDLKNIQLAAWAVRYGDVAALSAPTSPAPEPETYAMLLAGLGLMSAVARRRKTIES